MEPIMWLGVALVLFLGPVLFIHELGHFLAARRAGVRVLEFGFGFPPRLIALAREKGALVVDGLRVTLPPRLQLPTGLEVGQQVEALLSPVGSEYRALQVSPTTAPPGRQETAQGLTVRGTLTALELGTIYSLNLLPFGAFVRMLGEDLPSDPRSLAAQPKRWRAAVLLAGPLMNLLGAFLILTAAYMTGVPQREFVRIEQVIANSAAEEAGLQVGDVITTVAGVRVEEGAEQIRERIHASAEQPLDLAVVRAGQQLTITVTPRLVDGIGYLGIGMNWWPDLSSLKRYSLPEAAATAGSEMVNSVLSIFRLPHMVSTGEVAPSDVRPTGAAGILQLLAVFFKQSLEWGYPFPILQTTALISLAVGLTNLLPLPAMDGGRLLFITIEAVRGRRLNPMVEARVHAAGMALLLVLSVVLVAQDITNPLIPWSLLRR